MLERKTHSDNNGHAVCVGMDHKGEKLARGLAALTVTEWTNNDGLLTSRRRPFHAHGQALDGGYGDAVARHADFDVHRQADEEHSDMFLPFLEEYATGEKKNSPSAP